MKKIILPLLFLFAFQIYSQDLDVSIATWKNNALGAYNIIHDDYGSSAVDGIWQYADTIAFNRGITFTTGAISSACEEDRNVNGYSNPYDYAKKVMIEQHGHELINHTHNHTCALSIGWCGGEGWADQDEDYSVELEQSTLSIYENTGYQPRFFIYPYDQFSGSANEKLKELGYIGSRSGWNSNQAETEPYHRGGYDTYDLDDFFPDEDGFFRSAVVIGLNNSTGEADELNENAQLAIDQGVWVNRELHNVGASGWGNVPLDDYRTHMDFLQEKMKSGELWVGTVSEILTYQIQKLNYSVTAAYHEGDYYANVTFEKTDFDIASYLAHLTFKSPVSVNLDLSSYGGLVKMEILQNGVRINDYSEKNGMLVINVYPSEGDLLIKNIGGATLTGNQTVLKESEIVIYPNPSNGSFQLDMGQNNQVEVNSIFIYNSANQLVKEYLGEFSNEEFGEDLTMGIYFMKIVTDAGDITKKIVKM
jgi:hypothetical protein